MLNNPYASFYQRLYGAPDEKSIIRVLQDAGLRLGTTFVWTDQAGYEFIIDAFLTFHRLHHEDELRVTEFIRNYLLPLLLNKEAMDNASLPYYRGRELLREWLDGLTNEIERRAIQMSVLDQVVAYLAALPIAANEEYGEHLCWAITAIGLRRRDVTWQLWKIVEQNDALYGDTALSTLVNLGFSASERPRLLDELHRRLAFRWSPVLMGALGKVAHPRTIAVLLQIWKNRMTSLHKSDETDYADTFALRVFAYIAESADDDRIWNRLAETPTIPDKAWQGIVSFIKLGLSKLNSDLALGGDLAPLCDSHEVIPFLFDQFVVLSGADDQQAFLRYLAYRRASECLRPQQLMGWRTLRERHDSVLVQAIQNDACQNTGHVGRFSTDISSRKSVAWKTAFSLGLSDLLGWFTTGIVEEANPYTRGELCDMLASLQMPPSSTLFQWIRAERDIREDHSGEVIAQSAAIALGASCGTYDAFDALLHCGLRIDDHWERDTTESLASCAIAVARQGMGQQVVDALLARLRDGPTESDQTVAAIALERLAAFQLIPTDIMRLHEQLYPLLEDKARTPYQRGLLLIVLSELLHAQRLSLQLLEVDLVRWAREEKDWFTQIAIETLALFQRLSEYPDLLEESVGLHQLNGQWDFEIRETNNGPRYLTASPSPWIASVLAKLYSAAPAMYEQATATCLAHPSRWGLNPLMRLLSEQTELVTASISLAIIAGVYDGVNSFPAQTEQFIWAAQLIPVAFIHEKWGDKIGEWSPDAQAELAEALGEVVPSNPSEQQSLITHLKSLIGHGHYNVRRAAYHALMKHDEGRLKLFVEEWIKSEQIGLRRRAAEASAWISEFQPPNQPIRSLRTRLFNDPDPLVREDARRVWQERRERKWANLMLKQLLTASSWSNEEILALWPVSDAFVHYATQETLKELRVYLSVTSLPVHARTWLNRLLKEGSKQWRDKVDQWPKPWPPHNIIP